MINIMVMCTGNSFRSHIAESYIRKFANGNEVAGNNVTVYSSGVKASGKIYPWAIKLMAEEEIDISHHTSNNISEYMDIEFDFVITVCDNAKETCPIFPKPVKVKLHHSFNDYTPKADDMTDEEYMQTLRPIRDAIRDYCKNFVEEYSL